MPSPTPLYPSTAAPGRAPLPWLALLTGLGVLANGWPVPLYYGVHLLLGSTAPILALLLWRTWWAVPMGVVAALQTWRLWGHPWAVVIFGMEMLWLTVAVRRHHQRTINGSSSGRVVVDAMAYWLLLGCPLVLILYGGVMRIDPANVGVVAVKQAFNGVFNTVLAFSALILIQARRSNRQHGPGVSLQGVIMALSLLAITLPTLLVSLVAGHQLEVAVQRGALDGLQTVNLALGRSRTTAPEPRMLMQQLGEAMAYRRIEPDGIEVSSDPGLFQRLDAEFRDGGRSNVHDPDLAILIPRASMPTLRKWVNGYWSYSRQYSGKGSRGTSMVQVVEPARTVVTRLQEQSTVLLGASMVVLMVGALVSLWLGERFALEFRRVVTPLQEGADPLQPLQPTSVLELRELTQLINHRIQQFRRLSLSLRQANTELRRSRAELKGLLRRDPLTGCGNREALVERLREEVDRCDRSGEALSCLVIAVEDLTRINRELGRRAGEALLQGICQAAKQRLRRTDHFYRLSADTFVVLAIGCSAAPASQLGGALQLAMGAVYLTPASAPSAPDHVEVRSNVSIGVSSLVPSQDSGESLLQRALDALAGQGDGIDSHGPAP